MNIHEYQAKDRLRNYGVRVQQGMVIEEPAQAEDAAKKLQEETGTHFFVVKAQIHAGGRGKGTVKETGSKGVVVGKMDSVAKHVQNILGGTLETKQTGPAGKKVNKVLIAQDVYYPSPDDPNIQEFYLSITLDRAKAMNVIIASTEGGVEIEEVAEENEDAIIKEWIDPALGLQPFQARKVAFALGLKGNALKEMIKFINALYDAFMDMDASMFEINPVIKTSDDKILAVDAKVGIDDNALYRQKDIAALRDKSEEEELEVEASESGLNYIKLDGNVGCMVNGAGLAMATMDIIKLYGGEPANFLDVGGSANAQTVEAGFRIILKDPNVKAILINIFGGIVRCDRVASGVVEAYKNIGNIDVPIIVRLQGTNAEEGAKIIEESGLQVKSAILLKDAAEQVQSVLS
jgi:succinyl-CoA synthetase beta subunit